MKAILRKFLANYRATRAALRLAVRTPNARFFPTVSPNALACQDILSLQTPYEVALKKGIRATPILAASELSATLIVLPSAIVRNLPLVTPLKVVTVSFILVKTCLRAL